MTLSLKETCVCFSSLFLACFGMFPQQDYDPEREVIEQDYFDPLNWTVIGYHDPIPLIQTQFGPIQGRQDYDPNNRLDSEFYGGIPYAQAPTGLDRFLKPKKWTHKYKGVLDATNFKPPCPQLPYYPITPSFEGRDQYNQSRIPTSSDCLYLNIWRPAFPARGTNQNIHYYSTLVILYEDDFYMNRPEDPLMSGSGQSWSNDLLVITIAFRSGVLGYFNGSNVALYDIKMGLEWVYDNIHSWRGNNSKITVLGSNSAATLVTLLAMNQKHWTDKVINNIVLMSGKGLFSPGSFQSPKEIAFYSNVTAKELGCLIQSPDKNPEKSTINMTCMGMLSDEVMLSNAQAQLPVVSEWVRYYSRYPWTPVIDNDIVRQEVTYLRDFNYYNEVQLKEMFKRFELEGMNVLMGVNNNAGVNGLAFVGIVDIEDASYRTAYDFKRHTALLNSDLGQCGLSAILFQYHDWTDPPHPDRSRRDSLIRMCTDRFKRCPMVNLANFLMKQAQFGTPPTDTEGRVWVYQFEHPYGKVFPEWMGAIETSDFVYMMTHPMNTVKNPSFTQEEAALSLSFSSYIGNFVWYGDPNYVATPYWEGRDEKYTPEWTEATRENGKKYLSLKVGDISDRENLAATDCAFWHKLMPTLHEEFQYVIDESGILNLPTKGMFNFGRDHAGPQNTSYVRCRQEFEFQ
ncbi:acetylcholinesterase-like isoform X2 [Convolutriloba macropyga]|uniref:acetylcholinesterase-like isoform X2 n=1 Tax=Convolutriloba macropyga TaxID=536237 RepID=UPI003F5221A7